MLSLGILDAKPNGHAPRVWYEAEPLSNTKRCSVAGESAILRNQPPITDVRNERLDSSFAKAPPSKVRMRHDRSMRQPVAPHLIARHCDEKAITEYPNGGIICQLAATVCPLGLCARSGQLFHGYAMSRLGGKENANVWVLGRAVARREVSVGDNCRTNHVTRAAAEERLQVGGRIHGVRAPMRCASSRKIEIRWRHRYDWRAAFEHHCVCAEIVSKSRVRHDVTFGPVQTVRRTAQEC